MSEYENVAVSREEALAHRNRIDSQRKFRVELMRCEDNGNGECVYVESTRQQFVVQASTAQRAIAAVAREEKVDWDSYGLSVGPEDEE